MPSVRSESDLPPSSSERARWGSPGGLPVVLSAKRSRRPSQGNESLSTRYGLSPKGRRYVRQSRLSKRWRVRVKRYLLVALRVTLWLLLAERLIGKFRE